MFLKFFGFSEQPFGVTPDPRFLYMSPAHQEAFSSLVYGIETGRGFVALIAGPGLGKTTVLLRLMERLQGSARTAFLFQTHLQSADFLKSMVADLGIEPAGHNLSDLQQQFSEVLIQESRAGKRVVVAIDEAQNLDDATLEMVRMLSNFETAQAKLLQIILVGQKELADKLTRPNLEQFRQRISIITHFPPFDGDEVAKYISHRLQVAGYKGGPIFTPPAMRVIARQSGGIPRNINNLCFHALSLAFAKNQKVVSEAMVQEILTDLNLNLLGTGQVVQPVTTAASVAAGPATVGKPPEAGVRLGPEPDGPRNVQAAVGPAAPLDDIDLGPRLNRGVSSPYLRPSAPLRRPVSTLPVTPPREHGSRLVVLAVVLLAAVWATPRLKPVFDMLRPSIDSSADASAKPRSQNRDDLNTVPARSPAGNSGAQFPAPSSEDVPPVASRVGVPSPAPATRAESTSAFVRHLDEGNQAARIPKANAGNLDHPKVDASGDDLGQHGTQGLLVVQSNESGAHIRINSKSSDTWVTPHLFSLAEGVYNVTILKTGYKPWMRQIRIEGPREKWLTADLVADGQSGIFAVETDPPGMPVFVDGKAYGPSRVETELPVGWHVCEVVTGPGARPLVTRFHLDSGEALTRRIRITPTPAVPVGEAQLPPVVWNRTRTD